MQTEQQTETTLQVKVTDKASYKRMVGRVFKGVEYEVGNNTAKHIDRHIGLEGTGKARKSYWLLSQRKNGNWFMVNVNTAQALDVEVEFI